jgi:membrane protease YdiL (CAAX protease family)
MAATMMQSVQGFVPHWRTARSSTLSFRDRLVEEETVTDVTTQGDRPSTGGGAAVAAAAVLKPPIAAVMDLNLIKSVYRSQAMMVGFATLSAYLVGGSLQSWGVPTVETWIIGIAATWPMIALGRMVEVSSERDASHANFSTTNMVVSLFGRRGATTTLQVVVASLGMSLVTACAEETVFRGLLPAAIISATHSLPLAWTGQALLFGLGHYHKQSSNGENRIVVSLQALNGLLYGLVYYYGGLPACILTHTLYDMHVLVESWHSVNERIDYTETESNVVLTKREEEEILQIQEESGCLTSEMLAFCRRFFYAFDYDRKGTLSLTDVQRAVSYAFLQDTVVPTQEQVHAMFDSMVSKDRLNLPQFLRLLFALRSQAYEQS